MGEAGGGRGSDGKRATRHAALPPSHPPPPRPPPAPPPSHRAGCRFLRNKTNRPGASARTRRRHHRPPAAAHVRAAAGVRRAGGCPARTPQPSAGGRQPPPGGAGRGGRGKTGAQGRAMGRARTTHERRQGPGARSPPRASRRREARPAPPHIPTRPPPRRHFLHRPCPWHTHRSRGRCAPCHFHPPPRRSPGPPPSQRPLWPPMQRWRRPA